MQIHELNDYAGNLGDGAFLAVDNGSDTGRLSTAQLLRQTDANIEALSETLNARIDNIIAGDPAPSAAEVTDARLGNDGVTYPSLGDAIRSQIGNLKDGLEIISTENAKGMQIIYGLGELTFTQTADGRVKCTSEELQEGDIVYLTDPNYQLALSTANGASLQGWYAGPIVMTATRRYVAIRKSDSSNIQSLPGGQFSRSVYVVRRAKYYEEMIDIVSSESEKGNTVIYNVGELPFAITGDNRVKCSTIALNVGDIVYLRDTDNYRIGISQANGASPYGWFTGPMTITDVRRYVIFKNVNTTDISGMLNADVSNLIYVVKKSSYQRQIESLTNSYKFAHISFDDVRYCMEDITANAGDYTSIFDNPFFAKLKEWHETYGAIFSLYLFTENMANYTTAFATEFSDNADWLKFGFHSINGNSNFENTTGVVAAAAYDDFVDNIISIAGTVEVIDRLPRLGNFKGNLESMLAVRDCKCGIVGALSAYDTRDSYYLNSADSAYVKDHGKLYDATNYMTFYRTIMTMEVINPSTSLPQLLTKAEYNNSDYLIGMMHEYEIYTSSYALVSSMADRIEYACNWAVTNGYEWDYPMHRH